LKNRLKRQGCNVPNEHGDNDAGDFYDQGMGGADSFDWEDEEHSDAEGENEQIVFHDLRADLASVRKR